MHNLIRAALLGTGLSCALASPAMAEIVDLGVVELGETLQFEQSAGSFADSFSFVVGEPVDFTLDFSNLGLGSRASLSVLLNGTEIVGSFGRNLTFAWGPFTGGGSSAFPFASGTQFLVTVSGTDNSLSNPSYRLGITAAVPEPTRVAMLLSGLVAVAGVARHRMRSA
ncbi:PEP-CTERM sorting domain-containing protein [Methyloversatilis thermotolerans]|uniref:PEP-CTERM sorting domain-containing protein n=1 Tax=Methyloversatilis thermotolerans TaxID=1346290 RepID=UPI0003A24F3C|nr:PEP-CTERM sorting domain-containing protein [Methyloversatilis thermotolerans]